MSAPKIRRRPDVAASGGTLIQNLNGKKEKENRRKEITIIKVISKKFSPASPLVLLNAGDCRRCKSEERQVKHASALSEIRAEVACTSAVTSDRQRRG